MAEALSSKEQDHLLNCGICGGRLMDPRILDCLHSFCKECLIIKQEQAAIKDVVVCQLCDKKTGLPSKSTESLTTNIFALNLRQVDEIVNSNQSFHCSFCSEQGETESASSRCLTCGDWLCLVCASCHCGTSSTKNHKVVTIDDIRVNPKYLTDLRKLYESKCLSHEEKIIQYCTQCTKPTCVVCKQSDRQQHDSIPLEVAVERVKHNLSDLQQMFNGVEECDSESDMQISKRQQEVQSKERSLVQQLHDVRDRLIQNIQQQAETAELLISQKFEGVNLFLSEASNTDSKRSENTLKSRLFCERLQREGLPGEFIHFKDLLQRVKRDGYRRERLEFPPVPDVKLNINDFSLPSIFNVFESDQPVLDRVDAHMHASGDEQSEESILVTLGPEKPDETELKSSRIELIVEPKNESKKFDFRKSGLSFQVNKESHYDHDRDSDSADTVDGSESDVSHCDSDFLSKAAEVHTPPPLDLPVATPVKQQIKKPKEDDGIIPTLDVRDYRHVPLSTQSDKNPATVSDISWLTETEFAAGDKTNQKLKVFNKDGTLSWSKDVNGASLERLACVNGVIAFDYPSGVRLETQNKSFSKVYFHANNRNLSIPFPISETKGKKVIIANADFPQLRCYTTAGKKSEYLPLGRKIDINYISMNSRKEFFFTERNSKQVKKFLDGQGVSVFYKGLPDMVLEGIATDSRNNVYVSDSAGGDILKLDPSGSLLGILQVHPTHPQGMSISSDDTLLVCDGEGNAWLVHL